MTDRHVVVLGGGACGMTAALALARSGARVTVVEREPRPGGLCGTVEKDGFRFDFGGHRFLPRSRALEALVRELVGADLLERERSSVVLHRGERYRYPLELDDVVRRFGLRRGARAVWSYARERLQQRLAPSPDESFEDWVVHRFGRELYDAFFGPYTAKLWGLAPTEISADWAAQRISLPSLGDVLARLVGLGGDRVPRTYARRYLYPRRGIGQIFERMAEAVARAGGSVVQGARVVGLGATRDRRIASVAIADGTSERELSCDAVVSTIALPELVRHLCRATGGIAPTVERAAARLRFRAIRLLNLMLARREVSPHTWMYVSEPSYLAARIQEPRHRSPDAAPPGCSSLMLEIPCDAGDACWRADDGTLYERSLADLERLGITGLRGDTLGYFSTRVAEGYPVYHRGYRDDRARLLDEAAASPNLVSVGRQGAFRYVFMDTAMEMGIAAARLILRGLDGGDARRALQVRSVADLDGEHGFLEARALTA